jgi:hypothetical protein
MGHLPVSRFCFWLNLFRSAAWYVRHHKQARAPKNLLGLLRGVRDGACHRFGRPQWM